MSLFGTRSILASGLYQSGFEEAGLEFEFQDDWQEKIDEVISLIKAGNAKTGAARVWTALLREVESIGIQQAVIACTDINAVLPFVETSLTLVDSVKSLAQATVKKILANGG